MKYVKQLTIILGVTFIGEILHFLLPLPIPASIYGLLLMLILLCTKVLKVDSLKETSSFLLEAMPIMFTPPAAEIINQWGIIKPVLFPAIIMIVVVTAVVMGVTGVVTQALIRSGRKEQKKDA